MIYQKVSTQDVDELRASRTKRERMYDRAEHRAEPHWAHEADIEKVADEVLARWFRRAVRTGDEIVFLSRLYAMPDTRTECPGDRSALPDGLRRPLRFMGV